MITRSSSTTGRRCSRRRRRRNLQVRICLQYWTFLVSNILPTWWFNICFEKLLGTHSGVLWTLLSLWILFSERWKAEATEKKKKETKDDHDDLGGSNWLIGCKLRLEKFSDPAIQATRKEEEKKEAKGMCQAGGTFLTLFSLEASLLHKTSSN